MLLPAQAFRSRFRARPAAGPAHRQRSARPGHRILALPPVLLLLVWVGCGGGSARPPDTHVSWGYGEWIGSATSSDGQHFSFRFTLGGMTPTQFRGNSVQFTQPTPCYGSAPYLLFQSASGLPPGKVALDLWPDATKTGPHFQASATFPAGGYSGTGTYAISDAAPPCANSSGEFTLIFVPGAL